MLRINILFPLGVAALFASIVVVFTTSEQTEHGPLVNTTVGLVRGLRGEDGSVMFLGIPYAVIDEGHPFGPAKVNPKFEGVFEAFNDSARCPQLINVQGTSMDCLHLNIHVPEKSDSTPLPVFVYIHGGRFAMGSSGRDNFGPKYLIRHNVIFVSLNYRLGAYGFMCLHTPEVPGNQGLKDQLNALRWIKNNIRAFGGDDESITIAGDSAGGVSVDSHLLFSDEGLFHKMIAISGTALAPWGFRDPDLNAALKIATQLGFATNSTSEAIKFLSNQSPSQVLLAAEMLQIRFTPCVEKKLPNVEQFVTNHPVSTPIAKAKSIPIICGHTDDEWLINYMTMPSDAFKSLDVSNNNINIGFEFGAKHKAMKWFVRRFYAGDEAMSVRIRRAIIDFETDFLLGHPTQRLIRKYLDHGGTAYYYVFSYVGGRNVQRFRANVTEGGAAHADDLGYFFEIPDMKDTPTSDDQLMMDRITTLWTNFVKYGNPTPSITELLPKKWLPATRKRLNYLSLNKDLELRTRPFHQRLSFWDLFYHTNREYIKGYSDE